MFEGKTIEEIDAMVKTITEEAEKAKEKIYADNQAKWVRENGIKIGSKIKLKDRYNPFGEIFLIEEINKNYICIEGCLKDIPYFVLEPVK